MHQSSPIISHPVPAMVSRRRFLGLAAAGSVVFAIPAIVTRPLFGAASPNGRVNVAQIGCGGIGRGYHINILTRMEDVRIIAVADAYKSRREAAAAKLNEQFGAGTAKAYADFRDILRKWCPTRRTAPRTRAAIIVRKPPSGLSQAAAFMN